MGSHKTVHSRQFKKFFTSLIRRKTFTRDSLTKTELIRCLTTLDLTALGVGSTLGAGIYVVAGEVAKTTAGPSVILSFLIAAAASCLAGLCYAEFGARVPKTGSAYVYSYVSIGELMAFIIGWNLILEYGIGTASVARAWSANFDELINQKISIFFRTYMTLDLPGIASYPDFFAFGITMLLTILLAIGVKESAMFTKIFTALNLLVVLFVVVFGAVYADISNWNIDPETFDFENNSDIGNSSSIGDGGFFPFGIQGMISGASTCFYAFIGFDAIATTGEEVKNPQKALPISIISCLAICFAAYFGVSMVLTLMCPYFLLYAAAPLPQVFERAGWPVVKYVIAVGSVCALSTSLLGCMFPLPRIIYAMSSDGLLFRILARVNRKFKTPLIATILSGLLAGLMTCLFELKALVDMMSIGTLLAYTLVAVSVLILRGRRKSFAESKNDYFSSLPEDNNSFLNKSNITVAPLISKGEVQLKQKITAAIYLKYCFVQKSEPIPSYLTEKISSVNTYLLLTSIFVLDLCIVLFDSTKVWIIVMVVLFSVISLLLCFTLMRQPENQDKISFKVPLTPWIPALSIFINIYLMMNLSTDTWIRFLIWMAVGFLIYFVYGIWNSSETDSYKKKIAQSANNDLLKKYKEGQIEAEISANGETDNAQEFKAEINIHTDIK